MFQAIRHVYFLHQYINTIHTFQVCLKSGLRKKQAFGGEDSLVKFCEWLFRKEHVGSTAIAHNAKGYFIHVQNIKYIYLSIRDIHFYLLYISGYDAQFILRWIHKQAKAPSIIMRGMEILQLEYCGIKLLDSLNFLPMGLAAFPKALGFDAAKGYFPHLFNKKENWNVVLQGLPDKWLVIVFFKQPDKWLV